MSARRLKFVLWGLHGLLTLGLFWLILGSGGLSRVLLALLATLPLLAAWPGLLLGRGYTAAWASMIVAIYCALLLAEAYMQPLHKPVLLALACIAALDFVALILFPKAAANTTPGN